MTMEHKFVDLGSFKAINEGAGSFEGYASVFGELDDVGDIVLPGAYKDTIPTFLEQGFTAQSHDWNVSGGVIGYPTHAKEDAEGLFIRNAFHSTPDAQVVRTKALERQAAGKRVSLSIGYDIPIPPIMLTREQYADELPKYLRADKLEEGMAKAQRFDFIRLLPKLNLYEHSIVTVPALQSARVTAVKSADEGTDTKDAVPPAGATFAEEGETVLAAVKAYITRARDIQALRLKEGRVFSAANRAVIANAKDALMDLASVLDELLAMSEPKDEGGGGKAARREAARKAHIEALVREALRQQQGAYTNGN